MLRSLLPRGQLFYYKKRLGQTIINKTAYDAYTIQPELCVLPIPDDENTYGGRTEK